MKEKNLKLIMELIFIFILPLIIMLFSTSIIEENNFTYDSNGNYEKELISKKLSFDNSFIKFENGYKELNFNQLLNLSNVSVTGNNYSYSINNGLVSINGIFSEFISIVNFNFQVYKDHKYLMTNYNCSMPIYSNSNISSFLMGFEGNDSAIPICEMSYTDDFNYIFGIAPQDEIALFSISSPYYEYINESISISFYPQIYDLTQMFGVGNEPTTIEEFNKYINVNEFHSFTESQIIRIVDYTIWGKIKNLLIDSLSINNSIVLDIIICYTMLWFIMFVIWHFFYLFFDGLVHLFIDWKKRSE